MFDHFIIVSLLSPIRLIHRFMEGGVSGQGFLHRLDVPSSGLSLGDFCDAKSAQMIQICNRINMNKMIRYDKHDLNWFVAD